jgi:DNA-binding response OmpR family regulator
MHQLLGAHEDEGPDSLISTKPVLVFGRAEDLPRAFSLGCDDYLTESWTYPELRARVLKTLPPSIICIGSKSYRIEAGGIRSVSGSRSIPLSRPELLILKALVGAAGETVYREALHYLLRDEYRRKSRAVDMQVSLLRRKLKDLGCDEEPILSVRRQGYRISPACVEKRNSPKDHKACG